MRKFLCLLLLFPALALAKQPLTDSLHTALLRAGSDSLKADLHARLSRRYALNDISRARHHARQSLTFAAAAGLPAARARAYNLVGHTYLLQGRYVQALAQHYQALKIGEQTGDTTTLALTYNFLGIMSGKMKDSTRCLDYYQRAARLARKSGNRLVLSKVLNNLGDHYETQARYARSLSYYRQAAALQQQLGDSAALAVSLLNIGGLHLHLKKPQQGLPYLFRSLRLNAPNHNIMIQTVTLGQIARIYQAAGQPDLALRYARQAYQLARQTRSYKKIAPAADLLHQLYASRGDYARAYAYLLEYRQHEDSLDLAAQQGQAAQLTAAYEIEKKDLENRQLQAEKARQAAQIKHQQVRLLAVAVILGLMLSGLLLLLYSRRRLQRTHQALRQANATLERQHQEIHDQKNALAQQAQVLQQQHAQLEKHHLFRNKLFSIISHDLRAPFQSLRGILGLLQSKALTAEEEAGVLALLGRDVETASSMLNNLLAWAKVQLQGSALQLQPVALRQLADDNLRMAQAQASQKQVQLYNEIPENLQVFTDQERLNFVLRNLLMNALKFTAAGGEIRLQGRENAGLVELTVRDNGQGIAAEHLPRLFTEERFSTPGTSQEKGSGLGLRLSREFIESLQGTLTVESRPAQGSAFRVSLPRQTRPGASAGG
ncbi:MAG: tetratricopeptide repeat-containing sensor histidine kinase [Adhaeribacter sp.]